MHHHLHSLHLFGCTPCNPLTYLVSDAGTVKDSKSRHNLLVRRQECVLLPSLVLFLSIILLHCILRYSYGISFYFELAHEQSIRQSILRLIRYLIRHSICSIGRVYPYLTLYHEPLFIIALQRHPFLFLLHDKSLYEDEYESNTSFLTRDARRLAKDQTWKLEYRKKLETCLVACSTGRAAAKA